MMTNGQMEESIKQEAVLEDVDPRAFTQLVKFAYQGVYGVLDGVSLQALAQTMAQTVPTQFICTRCGCSGNSSFYPFCSSGCQSLYRDQKKDRKRYGRMHEYSCVKYQCIRHFNLDRNNEHVLCDFHRQDRKLVQQYPNIEISSDVSSPTVNPVTGMIVPASSTAFQLPNNGHFLSLRYEAAGLSHDQLNELYSQHASRSSSSDTKSKPHAHHSKDSFGQPQVLAQTYILANKYLVDDLPEICLHKLQRHLANHEPDTFVAITAIIDLVQMVYSNTSAEGDILTGDCDQLRLLVMTYVCDQSEELLDSKSTADVLAGGGQPTSDFMRIKWARDKGRI